MARSVFLNRLPGTTRVAVAVDGRLERYLLFGDDDGPRTGDVHLGRVTSVLPSIQALFVDIGQKEPAFLNGRHLPHGWLPDPRTRVQDVVKPGRVLAVQVTRPPVGGKQVQVSARLKLGGFWVELSEGQQGLRFSGHFSGDRDAVRQALDPLFGDADGVGLRVRSAASDREPELVAREAGQLIENLKRLRGTDLEGVNRRLWRPFFLETLLQEGHSDAPRAIYCDDQAFFEEVRARLAERAPSWVSRVQLHLDAIPLFDVYKITSQISEATSPRVWLKSGGFLEIHQTEAMVTIDVNSGKNTKARGGQSGPLRTNLEAVREGFHQIRLRQLAGLIALDLISMKSSSDRNAVSKAIRAEIDRTDGKIDIATIDRFGIVVLARERRHADLTRTLMRPCPTCGGSGWSPKPESAALDVQGHLLRDGETLRGEALEVVAAPDLFHYLEKHRKLLFQNLEREFELEIRLVCDDRQRGARFEIRPV